MSLRRNALATVASHLAAWTDFFERYSAWNEQTQDRHRDELNATLRAMRVEAASLATVRESEQPAQSEPAFQALQDAVPQRGNVLWMALTPGGHTRMWKGAIDTPGWSVDVDGYTRRIEDLAATHWLRLPEDSDIMELAARMRDESRESASAVPRGG